VSHNEYLFILPWQMLDRTLNSVIRLNVLKPFRGIVQMMSHEECVAYIKNNELGFEPGNYYGGLTLKNEDSQYFWSVENYDGHCWNSIPDYLGDALVNYYREDS
jgi:hypothetical protein